MRLQQCLTLANRQEFAECLQIFQTSCAPYKGRKNPCSLPVPFTTDHLRADPKDYVLAKKHDGERFQLIVGPNASAYVDRLGKFWKVYVEAPASMRLGTVFDGEILERSGCFVFVIFDVLLIDGVDVKQREFDVRQKFCQDGQRSLRHGYENSVHIDCIAKHIVDAANVEQLKEDIFPSDGYVLTHKIAPYCLFESHTMIKWKAVHTVDIELKNRVPLLYDSNRREVRPLHELMSTLTSQDVRTFEDVSLWSLPAGVQNGVVECVLTVADGSLQFKFQQTRPDKRHGNSWQTLQSTAKVVVNCVNESRFLEWCVSTSGTQAKRKKMS